MTAERPLHQPTPAGRSSVRIAALPALLVALAALASGCRPGAYFADRWADAKDVFTVSVGKGAGAKARVGPVNAGLFLNEDVAGLRGGECFYYPYSFLDGGPGDGVMVLVLGGEVFDLHMPPPLTSEPWGQRHQWLQNAKARRLAERGKSFEMVLWPGAEPRLPRAPYYYTQLEVAAGVYGTLRLGCNPGELLDFILGWTTLDIFGDDAEAGQAGEQPEEVGSHEPEGALVRPWPRAPYEVPPPMPAPAPARSGLLRQETAQDQAVKKKG